MAQLAVVQSAWVAWDNASPLALDEQQRAIALTQSLTRAIDLGQAPPELDARALWDWLAMRWTAWCEYDASHAQEKELRRAGADGMQALLALARNSAAQRSSADVVRRHWDSVSRVMAHCLLFENMNEPALLPTVRTLAQFVANAGTSDSSLQQMIWHAHVLGQGSSSNPDAIQRLLSSSDTRTTLAAAVFLLNCIDTTYQQVKHGLIEQAEGSSFYALVETPAGLRIIETLLGVYEAELLTQSSSDASSPMDQAAEEVIRVIIAIIQRLFQCGVFGDLLEALSPPDNNPPRISSAQVSLLRVLAIYLEERLEQHKFERHTQSKSSRMLDSIVQTSKRYTQSITPLLSMFCQLSDYTTQTMRQHMDGAEQVDLRGLIRAHMMLLALLHCLHLAGMCAQEDIAHQETSGDTEILAKMRDPKSGIVDACITLLHESNQFFPAQSPFQSSTTPSSAQPVKASTIDSTTQNTRPSLTPEHDDNQQQDSDLATDIQPRSTSAAAYLPTGQLSVPEHHVPTQTSQQHPISDTRPALYRLKSSVLQLLGTLAFEPPRVPHLTQVTILQDRVREKGGVLDTLNLTQLDKNNPWNPASQNLVASLRPVQPNDSLLSENQDVSPP
ncbi:hypothetical protein MYAM1_003766 [Malassezia yamatoensis]|uniref:Ataxin-10 domain-containing protein n=1 Tax=Malassezia yamatoensis TaxID=253288 RepID=A0AAJ6CJ69_9BASI|nr:hypothetical protein MYAM1_003766 [Malassezia yamatoensis]